MSDEHETAGIPVEEALLAALALLEEEPEIPESMKPERIQWARLQALSLPTAVVVYFDLGEPIGDIGFGRQDRPWVFEYQMAYRLPSTLLRFFRSLRDVGMPAVEESQLMLKVRTNEADLRDQAQYLLEQLILLTRA